MQRSILFTLMAAVLAVPVLAAPVAGAGLADFSAANTGTLVGDPILQGTAAQVSATEMLLTGGDAAVGCQGGVYSDATSPCALMVTLGLAGDYRFHWAYNTADGAGPAGDIFGVVVDGQRSVLSDLGGPVSQSGSASFSASSSFAWFINCTDCSGGSASVSITQFTTTAVPEPATGWLLMAGLAGVGGVAGVGGLGRQQRPAG